jgi:RimJ/RimL family protein N-acetyltransferase
MSQTEIISFESHVEWVENLNVNAQYYAVLVNERIVGNLNFTEISTQKKTCTWGCYFKDDVHAFIISAATVKFIDYLFNKIGIEKLNLYTKMSNLNALSFDRGLGFCEYKRDSEYIYMTLDHVGWKSLQTASFFKPIIEKINRIDFEIES